VRSRSARRRGWLLAIAILVALTLAGALYQTLSVRSESGRFPASGRLINVARAGERSERRLHLICLGQGEPTVIFESSVFGSALSSRAAREEVSAHTRVCSYDRMGMGWSDPGPAVISVGGLADDLERLTMAAELRPPYILAPASLGVLRLFDPLGLRKDNSFESTQMMARLYRVEPMTTLCGVARGFRMTTHELSAAPPLAPDIPLIVLVHERPDGLFPPGFASYEQSLDRDWLNLQQRFAQRSSRGTWRVVPESDHLIGNSQPHAVAAAILEMLGQIRRIR